MKEKNNIEKLLEEQNELVSLRDEKQEELNNINECIMRSENELQAYNSYKKDIIKTTIINLLEILGLALFISLPINLLNGGFLLVSAKTLKIINSIAIGFGLFGSSILLTLSKVDLVEYKNDKEYLKKSNIDDLEDIKSYLEDLIKSLNNDIELNNNQINRIHNENIKSNIELKYDNVYENENDLNKKKVFKK